MRTRIALIILFTIVLASCERTQQKPVEQLLEQNPIFTDNVIHLALYCAPKTDCITCLNKGITYVSNMSKNKNPVCIITQRSSQNSIDAFKKYLIKDFPDHKYDLIQADFKLPTPSIIIFKGKGIYMYYFIPTDIYDLNETMMISRELFDLMDILK